MALGCFGSEQTERSQRWFPLIFCAVCVLKWKDSHSSQNKQVVVWYLLWTVSVGVWTAGIGVSIYHHMIQFWPAEPVYWGFSRGVGCGLYHHKTIHRGVRAELQQLKRRPSLTQVSCPYSVDELPQLWCYLKQSRCCPRCPAGLITEEAGAPLPWEFIEQTPTQLTPQTEQEVNKWRDEKSLSKTMKCVYGKEGKRKVEATC